ncbi:MAG: ABC transporter ATP-binding protein, partial [Bacteroidetes bacterium]
HDRFLLDKLCDHLFVFQGNGKIKDFNGRYMEYRKWVQEQEKAQRASSATNSGKSPKQEVRTGTGLTKQQKNELKKLEREIAELEQRKAELHQAFTRTDLGLDKIQQLSNELKEVEASLEEKELRWMELAELIQE